MEYLDEYLCDKWNEVHPEKRIADENTWEFCRILMEAGLLESNKSAVSTTSIGPFRIASKMKIKRRDVYDFLLDTVFPIALSASNILTFHEACTLYLIPAAKFVIAFLDNNYLIKDSLQWDILLYIKGENACNRYPKFSDLEKDEKFAGYEREQLKEALMGLEKHLNLNKDKCSLVEINQEGRIKSNV